MSGGIRKSLLASEWPAGESVALRGEFQYSRLVNTGFPEGDDDVLLLATGHAN